MTLMAVLISGQTGASETSFDATPYVDLATTRDQIQSERGIIDLKFHFENSDTTVHASGFAYGDAADTAPDLRGDRNVAALQEAYFEFRGGDYFSVRAGRQAVRWSESWTLPSLDIWTARRWQQMFLLPVPFQLIHPTGILLTYDNGTSSINFFSSFIQARDEYPAAYRLPAPPRPEGPEYGIKLKTRLAGFDMAAVAANQTQQRVFGGNMTYAFDWGVPKIEGGGNDRNDRFLSAGIDFFAGNWSLLPQLTVAQSNLFAFTYERLGYFPIRYSNDPHTFEAQGYYNFETQDQFFSVLYTHSFRNGLQLTGYLQNYLGQAGSLFGAYQFITGGGMVYGARASWPVSL